MRLNLIFPTVLIVLAMGSPGAAMAQQIERPEAVFATIDDAVISAADYQRIFHAAVRNRYYHGKVPQPELARFQREVGRDVVDQYLAHREAVRLGLSADAQQIREGLVQYDARLADQPKWQEQRKLELPAMQDQLERRDLLLQLEEKIKNQPQPGSAEVEAYYRQHPEKFTEPERKHVSIILLRVPPSAGGEAWESAAQQAEALRLELSKGADFGELAKANSQDPSAANGGDLGFVHAGMLAGESEAALDKLDKGEITAPIGLLEGVALFRLNGRSAATLQDYGDVRERAASLLYRERQSQAWETYMQDLRSASNVEVNESLYMPLADAAAR